MVRALLLRTVTALALCAAASTSAPAMTVGEFRQAFKVLHALDPMTTEQRLAYLKSHHTEVEVARTQLEAAEMVRQSLLRMNAIMLQQGRPPFICNYNDEAADFDLDLGHWVDEFRSEAFVRFNLIAGPKSDSLLDAVEFDDVITNKILEKFGCPATVASGATNSANTGTMPTSPQHVHAH